MLVETSALATLRRLLSHLAPVNAPAHGYSAS